jgi:CBS domain-containing protein
MHLGEQFKKEVVTVEPDATIRKAAQLMREHGVGAVVVVNEKGVPQGIVTDRDVAIAVGANERDPYTAVRHIMRQELVTIGETKGLFNAAEFMKKYQVRRLPIVDSDGKLVGMVTMDDLFALLARELGNLAEGAVEPVLAAVS